MSTGVDLSKLNDSQLQIATTLDAPLFVAAGAGSGKTSTLTQRVAWALSPGSGEGGAPFLDGLDQVLVITFTEAAAREIKERVRASLRAAGMDAAALQVDEAWISTIHAMCRRILVRHALDLGLDPTFSVVADAQRDALYDRAMDDVMRDARVEGRMAPLLDVYELGTRLPTKGYTGLMEVVDALVGTANALPRGFDDLFPAAQPPEALYEVMNDFKMRLEELLACGTKATEAKVAPLLERLRAFLELPEAQRTAAATLEFLTDEVKLPGSTGAAAKEALDAAKAARALAHFEAWLGRGAELAPLVLELAHHVDARYAQIKHDANCLDNNDLIREALRAVEGSEEIRRDYAGRFKLVMVDEFQDTDEQQLRLITLLAGGEGSNLCTVGDAQQSIYRFRGADVGVFRDHGARVGEKNTVRLDVNYRSHADILAFVERVFTGRGTDGVLMPDFMHLDHNPGRNDRYRARELPRVDVEVTLGSGSSNGGVSPAMRATVAAQIADALARYRDAGERPGDMALLLGAAPNASVYIDAIRARGMECVVTGGSLFVKTTEVKIMRALLHVLANPKDTKSGLFPLLASEVFGLDADDLCALGTEGAAKTGAPKKRNVWSGLLDMTFFHDQEPSERLLRAREVLGRAWEDVRRRPVADVCADVVRDSGWLARLEAAGTEGRARAANVLLAIRHIRDLTEELGLGVSRAAYEFDRWADAVKESPGSLHDVVGEKDGGAVSVMTIHASKGLEFDVCAVAECWIPKRGKGPIAVISEPDGSHQFALRLREGRPSTKDLERIDPEEFVPSADLTAKSPLRTLYMQADLEKGMGDAQERVRLLYVALTRAKEALVVGVCAPTTAKGEISSALAASTLDAITGGWETVPGERALDYGGSAPARLRCVIVNRESKDVVVADSAKTLAGFDGELPATSEQIVRLGLEQEEQSEGPEPFDLYEADSSAHLGAPRTWRPREGVFSYSSVRAEQDGSSKPERERRGADADVEEAPPVEDADRATDVGSAFHELAQAMVERGGAVDDARVSAQVRRWHLRPRGEERLRAALGRWERSAVRAEALAWPRVRAEVPFFQRVDSPHGTYLEGAMDLLCTDAAARRALVVDYKTGDARLTLEEVRERHAMQAEFYANVLLAEGYEHVDCAFVCVEREDPEAPGEPLVVRYAFDE